MANFCRTRNGEGTSYTTLGQGPFTYLLFLRRLDDLQTLEENKSARLGRPIERCIFPEGNDPRGKPYAQLRWSRFKHAEAREMFTVVGEHVFPFLRTLGGDDSTYAHHMKDARFTIPTPALLAKAVNLLDHVPMEDRDTKGDSYEYMLGKIGRLINLRNDLQHFQQGLFVWDIPTFGSVLGSSQSPCQNHP